MEKEQKKRESWTKFVKRHKEMTAFMVIGVAIAAVTTVLVFLSVVANAQAAGLVPMELGLWSVSYFITFVIHLLFWEAAFVASWLIPLSLIIYFAWYKELPEKERKEYEGSKCRKSKDNGFSFFIGLIWLVIVWVGGKWDLAFQAWTFNDWIFTWLSAGLWALLIVGIPGTMYVIWSLVKK